MPRGDGTGPDGKGPKRYNKGWPSRDGRGRGAGKDRPLNGFKNRRRFQERKNQKNITGPHEI